MPVAADADVERGDVVGHGDLHRAPVEAAKDGGKLIVLTAPLTENLAYIIRAADDHLRGITADGETQGELVLRAPWLTEGYFNEPQKGAELWAGGWLHTGDVATLDSMGVIDIRDRIKDVIKTGGEWISSLDLEDLISRHVAVREVAVVGIADPQWGERPFALLVVREGHAIGARELKGLPPEYRHEYRRARATTTPHRK